jgi:hypothetical protein
VYFCYHIHIPSHHIKQIEQNTKQNRITLLYVLAEEALVEVAADGVVNEALCHLGVAAQEEIESKV